MTEDQDNCMEQGKDIVQTCRDNTGRSGIKDEEGTKIRRHKGIDTNAKLGNKDIGKIG